MKIIDSYRHQGLRKKLVAILKKKGILDPEILSAIGKIPRHAFLDLAFEEWAYQDKPFPIAAAQTISQPYTVAFQTHLLDIKKGDRVLEIGTGSGYQACVLYEMGAKVYTVERHDILFKTTNVLLQKLGYDRIRTFLQDGMNGLERFAPYDKIIVTAAAPEIPTALIEQLKPEGYLVVPFGKGENQEMFRICKKLDGSLTREKCGAFRFVPLLPGLE